MRRHESKHVITIAYTALLGACSVLCRKLAGLMTDFERLPSTRYGPHT